MSNQATDSLDQLWGKGSLRTFISHKATHLSKAIELQNTLRNYGFGSFVAYTDVQPMRKWQEAIEQALQTMDILLALLTQDFNDSEWTDQEVGFALGRGIPVVPIKLGRNPYGFIGKYQAINGENRRKQEVVNEVLRYCLDQRPFRKRATDNYITAIANAKSFYEADLLLDHLPSIREMSFRQTVAFRRAYNANKQIYRSRQYKKNVDVIYQVKRLSGYDVTMENGMIVWDETPF